MPVPNPDSSIGDILAIRALEQPRAVAVRTESAQITYEELNARAEALARWLLARGVEPGARVAVVLPNDWQLLVVWMACAKAGLVFVPVNTGFGHSEMAALARSAVPSVLVTTVDRSDACETLGSGSAFTTFVDRTGTSGETFDDLDATGTLPPVSPAAPLSILYTSGTTGTPKGVVHDALFWNAFAARGYAEAFDFGEHTRYLGVMPLFHVNGLGYAWSILFHGGTLSQKKRFSATQFWVWARTEQSNGTFIIGAMANMLLARGASRRDREHQLHVIATSALVPEKTRLFEERFGCVLLSSYGMTEGGGCTEWLGRRRPGSAGVATSGIELRVTGAHGSECSPGQPGRIELRDVANGLALGYWRDGGGIASSIRGAGRFATSDFGRIDGDGFLFFESRARDRLRRAGENIAAVEIEDVLRAHPAVLEAAVIGVPDPIVDEEVKAFVQLVAPDAVSIAELADYAAERLASFKCPRYWESVADLPLTPTRRVKKHELAPTTEPPVVDLATRVRGRAHGGGPA
jgi:crotonobetaine/carnitine-CoA ligase